MGEALRCIQIYRIYYSNSARKVQQFPVESLAANRKNVLRFLSIIRNEAKHGTYIHPKKNKNSYQLAREELGLTWEKASELLETIAPSALKKLRTNAPFPAPMRC